jgi:hypothetical protein
VPALSTARPFVPVGLLTNGLFSNLVHPYSSKLITPLRTIDRRIPLLGDYVIASLRMSFARAFLERLRRDNREIFSEKVKHRAMRHL